MNLQEKLTLREERRKKREVKRRSNEALDKAAGRKKEKLPPIKKLKKILWKITADIVKKRDSILNCGLCLTCNNELIYSANHIIPSSDSLAVRYDLDNLYGGGLKCNKAEMSRRSHWARVVFPRIFGKEKMEDLTARSLVSVDWKRPEYMAMIEERQKIWNSMNGLSHRDE